MTCLPLLLATFLTGDAWPQFMGPNRTGVIAFDGKLSSLEKAWQVELGSGFSGIAVSGEQLYTMYSDGDRDVLASFDASTGKRLWRVDYAPRYLKVGGSEDGPVSTPALSEGWVFALGSAGQVLACNAKDGTIHWQRHLVTDYQGKKPIHGFSGSPLVFGNLLILITGSANGKSVVALDKTSGELKWSANNDTMDYQSPSLMTLANREYLMVPSASHINAYDGQTGKLLWRAENANGIQAIPLSDSRFLLDQGPGFAAYELTATDGKTSVSPLWRNELLELGFDVPVVTDDMLVGFKGEFLTALDKQSGERLWKERVGRGSTLLLGRYLMLWLSSGELVGGTVTSDGFTKTAQATVLERGSLTYPAYADQRLFVRNLTHLARVDIK